jgi:acyl-CoA dehydrogenase
MKSCLEWPFFEERHRRLAGELHEFAEGISQEDSPIESQCKAFVRRLGNL